MNAKFQLQCHSLQIENMKDFIRAIAIDDEPIAFEILQRHASLIPFLNLVQCFVSTSEAEHYLKNNPVDLVFLDIEMPDKSGLDFALALKNKYQVIFITAYSNYALQGFELAATDYLLKPISLERFVESCKRALENFHAKNNYVNGIHDYIFIKSGYELIRIDLNELLFIQSADNYLILYEAQKQTIARMTLGQITERLAEKNFMRIHNSYIVSLSKILHIENKNVVIGRHSIPLSKKYKAELIKRVR